MLNWIATWYDKKGYYLGCVTLSAINSSVAMDEIMNWLNFNHIEASKVEVRTNRKVTPCIK